MILHVVCGYPSKSQGTYENWKQADFTAYKFVRAVKGKSFNGYGVIVQNGSEYRFESDAAGRATAMRVAGIALAGKIFNGLNLKTGIIIPVPASDHVNFGEDFTGGRLARAISSAFGGFRTFPNLTFAHVMQKASEGGPRDPTQLLGAMRLQPGIPDGPVILVDDVTSTHGHLKAAARLLRNSGREVAGAVCVAQTVWERPANIFGIPPKDTSIDTWPGDEPGLFG